MGIDIMAVINVVRNAQGALKTAIDLVNQIKNDGPILSGDSEEQLEAEIKKLEDMLPDLRAATQQKLRGT